MKTRSMRVSAAALFIAAAPLVASADPVQWKIEDGGNGHYYEVIPAAEITWDAANAAATAREYLGVPGYLATITSAEENTFLFETFGLNVDPKPYWLGGIQNGDDADDVGGAWEWVTGEPWEFTMWSTGEPTNTVYDGYGYEDALSVASFGGQDLNSWNDAPRTWNLYADGGYIVEYGTATETAVEPSEEDVVIFNQGGNNPLTAAYQKVLEGGAVKISCCVVEDTREGPNGYQPNPFDIGLALADTTGNPSCEGMPEIDQGAAMLHKWQRGVSNPSWDPDGDQPEHPLGVCVLESEVESEGVLFTAEDASNVLGYDLDCAAPNVSDRPFTGTVHLDPTEVDAPYVVRRSADCDGSRSGFRASTNVIVLNLRHDTAQMATNPYLSKDASALKASIDAIKAEGCVDPVFLETLAVKVQSAKQAMQKAATGKGLPGTANSAVDTLDEATKMALLIGVADDPYEDCGANPKGLLVSRLLALKFAACSELQESGPGDHSSSSKKDDPRCVIEKDIWDELPALPGQCRFTGDSACSISPSP